MPRIDPLQLLTCLKVLLDKNGGILSLNEVKRIAGLMTKYSKKLVSKCIYIQILKCTKTDLLGEFMGAGGWQLVNLWLTDGLRAMNYPLVTEILELFLLCPVDVERLKSNTSPKLVKQLSKEGPPDVRILATRLVEQWLNIVKASNLATSNNQSTGKSTDNGNKDNKHLKDSDIKKEIENSKTDKIENMVESKSVNKNNDNATKSFASPKRKMSTESSSSLTLKIVVKDGKQVVSKVDDAKESDLMTSNESKDHDEIDHDLDQQSESDESSDKLSNKENENKSKEESSDSKECKDIKDKEKHKEKDKHKEKSKDKSKSSSKEKDRHKSSSSSSKSSKSHSSSSSSKSSSSSSNSSKIKHSSSKSSKDKDRDTDKEKDREKEKEHKHKSSSKSSSKEKHKHDKEKSLKDKEKEREKEKASQAEKDKDTLSKIMPTTLEKLGKIPKKPKDPNEPETVKPTSITIPSKKASMSIEIRKDSEKAKTVKTYKSQFRSHGLTEEAPPPPSRKQLKKPVNIAPVSVPAGGILGSSSFASSLKRSSPPLPNASNSNNLGSTSTSGSITNNASGPPLEKKPKIDMTGIPSNVVEKPGSIKLIAPKPKPSLVESDMFMDALSAAAVKKHAIPKRKRRPSNSVNAESPTSSKAEPLKFYQDTLEVKEEDKSDIRTDNKSEKSESENDTSIIRIEDDDDDIPLKKVKEDIDQKTQAESITDENEKIKDEKIDDLELGDGPKSPEEPYVPIKKPPGPGCGPNGPPGVLMLNRRPGPKKKLKWRVQEELEEIRYFELDENERVNVTKAFTDMKNMERMHERESFILARKLNNEDLMIEQTQWRPLIMVDDAPPHPEGCKSKEKTIQADRERTTLKALYFSHAMIPDSPSEPDMEQYLITEPKVIPLDDITGNNSTDTVNDFVSYGYPEPKGTPPPDHEDDPMDGVLGLDSIPGTEIPFGNQNNQFNPFLPFGGQPIGNNNQTNWVGGLGPNGNMLQPNNMSNMNNINMLRPTLAGAINGPMNGPLAGPINGPPPLMETAPLGPINNGPFNMPHNIMPFGPNGPPNGMINRPPHNLLNSIFGPNGIQQQLMNMNGMNNGPMHNQMMGGNRNNQNSGGGNWRALGPPNNNNNNSGGGNWRSNNNNDRGNNNRGGNDRSNWVHGNVNVNRSVCKQFLRGFCRNGNKCNYLHPGNNQRI